MTKHALLTTLAALAVATPVAAIAAPGGGSAPSKAPVSGGGAPAKAPAGGGAGLDIRPVTEADLRPVSSDIKIFDATGAVVETRSCEWTLPEDDDRPCLSFQGDPDTAIAAIRSAGGSTAQIHIVSTPIGLDSVTTIARRGDGIWLWRTRGEVEGKRLHNGHVCSADGETCRRWDAKGARSASKEVRAAASKLRAKKR